MVDPEKLESLSTAARAAALPRATKEIADDLLSLLEEGPLAPELRHAGHLARRPRPVGELEPEHESAESGVRGVDFTRAKSTRPTWTRPRART